MVEAPLDVAACIVTYQSDWEKLSQAVESFQRYSGTSHLAIVDNDSGEAYVKKLQTLNGITLIESGANAGFGFGHNIAIAKAPKCRYYAVVNPDVVIHDGTLETMVEYMDAHPEIGLLAPKVLFPDGTLQPLNKRLPSVFDFFARRFLPKSAQRIPWIKRKLDHYVMHDIGYGKPVEVPFISGCFMLFRKEVLDKVGGFDEHFFMYLEDCDITRRVGAHAKAMFLPDATITHHWSRGSYHSVRLLWVMVQSMWVYYQKWGWKWV